MELFDPENIFGEYIEDHSTPQDEILEELYRYTYLNAVNPRMTAGPVQGKFLEMISRMIRPEKILEIGTYTGYSAICLARGLKPGGKLVTIEKNDELKEISLHFFEKAGLSDKIELINGDAEVIIPGLQDTFNLVYLDSDKEQYPVLYPMIKKLLKENGYLIADNVLWDGKVIENKANTDKSTRGILHFNQMVQDDPEVENLLLPFRDGVMMIWKKPSAGESDY